MIARRTGCFTGPKHGILITCLSVFLTFSIPCKALSSGSAAKNLRKSIGQKDAALLADPAGAILFSMNRDKPLIPASTLKILTALVGLRYLGPDFRFRTDFFLNDQSDLTIKGYGDPFLVSETVAQIAGIISRHVQRYDTLVLDDSYFDRPLTIPGVTSSYQPYDAPNSALCVNFNTVYFHQTKSGAYVSAEPQTPLLPEILPKVRASGLKKGRIIFSQVGNEVVKYAGYLFRYYFNKAGIHSAGGLRTGRVHQDRDRLIYRYTSQHSLKELVVKLMEHSNNFMANQILIAAGAAEYGPPGTLEKGVRTARRFAADVPGINNLSIVEGSGISRKNRLTAEKMLTILNAFKPYHHLMRYENGVYYKTGTLSGISTRAGYIERSDGELFPFVVFLNSKGKSAENYIRDLKSIVEATGN